MKINNFKAKIIYFIKYSVVVPIVVSFFLVSCGPLKPKKVDLREIPGDPKLKREKNIREGRGFRVMGMIEGNKGGGNFQFASSNEMWRATLELLEFTPLSNIDYSGGQRWGISFGAGEYDTNKMTQMGTYGQDIDNTATHVSVGIGCKIIVYDNGDFSGMSYTLEGGNDDFYNLADYGFQNKISSFKIGGLNDNLEDKWRWDNSNNENLMIYYDSDGDGRSDGEEFVLGTNLLSYDSDGDGLSDGIEVLVYNTNATNFDSDDDGASDFDEIVMYGTYPNQNHNPVVFFNAESKDWLDINDLYEYDADNDIIADAWDNCKDDYNPGQYDSDSDGQGDSCETSSYNSGSSSGGYSSGGSSSSSSNCDALMYYDEANDLFYLYDPCTGQMVIV